MSQFEEGFAETAGRMDEVQHEQLDLIQDDSAIKSMKTADNPDEANRSG